MSEIDRLAYEAGEEIARVKGRDTKTARIRTARIRLRDDNGPTGELGGPEEFIQLDGLWYPVKWIKSVPGIRDEQLEDA